MAEPRREAHRELKSCSSALAAAGHAGSCSPVPRRCYAGTRSPHSLSQQAQRRESLPRLAPESTWRLRCWGSAGCCGAAGAACCEPWRPRRTGVSEGARGGPGGAGGRWGDGSCQKEQPGAGAGCPGSWGVRGGSGPGCAQGEAGGGGWGRGQWVAVVAGAWLEQITSEILHSLHDSLISDFQGQL